MSIPIFVRCTFSSSWKSRHCEPSLKWEVIRRCSSYMTQMDQLLGSWIFCVCFKINVSVSFCEDRWRLCHATLPQSALSLPLRGDGASHWSAHGILAQQRHVAREPVAMKRHMLRETNILVEQWLVQGRIHSPLLSLNSVVTPIISLVLRKFTVECDNSLSVNP